MYRKYYRTSKRASISTPTTTEDTDNQIYFAYDGSQGNPYNEKRSFRMSFFWGKWRITFSAMRGNGVWTSGIYCGKYDTFDQAMDAMAEIAPLSAWQMGIFDEYGTWHPS